MKTHQPIIVVTLSCLLMLTSACGKKSVRGVSGVEDLFSSEGNHEVTGHDKALYGDPLVQLGETSLGDGWDAGAVDALSAADLHDEKGGTAFAGGGQGGSSSVFPCFDEKQSIGFFRWGFWDGKQQRQVPGRGSVCDISIVRHVCRS